MTLVYVIGGEMRDVLSPAAPGQVLTLSPGSATMHPQQFVSMDQKKVSERSWQPGGWVPPRR
jgi:hypothetical protein